MIEPSCIEWRRCRCGNPHCKGTVAEAAKLCLDAPPKLLLDTVRQFRGGDPTTSNAIAASLFFPALHRAWLTLLPRLLSLSPPCAEEATPAVAQNIFHPEALAKYLCQLRIGNVVTTCVECQCPCHLRPLHNLDTWKWGVPLAIANSALNLMLGVVFLFDQKDFMPLNDVVDLLKCQLVPVVDLKHHDRRHFDRFAAVAKGRIFGVSSCPNSRETPPWGDQWTHASMARVVALYSRRTTHPLDATKSQWRPVVHYLWVVAASTAIWAFIVVETDPMQGHLAEDKCIVFCVHHPGGHTQMRNDYNYHLYLVAMAASRLPIAGVGSGRVADWTPHDHALPYEDPAHAVLMAMEMQQLLAMWHHMRDSSLNDPWILWHAYNASLARQKRAGPPSDAATVSLPSTATPRLFDRSRWMFPGVAGLYSLDDWLWTSLVPEQSMRDELQMQEAHTREVQLAAQTILLLEGRALTPVSDFEGSGDRCRTRTASRPTGCASSSSR